MDAPRRDGRWPAAVLTAGLLAVGGCREKTIRHDTALAFLDDGGVRVAVTTSFEHVDKMTEAEKIRAAEIVSEYVAHRDPWLAALREAGCVRPRHALVSDDWVDEHPEIERACVLEDPAALSGAFPDETLAWTYGIEEGRAFLEIAHLDEPPGARDDRTRVRRAIEDLAPLLAELMRARSEAFRRLAEDPDGWPHAHRAAFAFWAHHAGVEGAGQGDEMERLREAVASDLVVDATLEAFEAWAAAVEPFDAMIDDRDFPLTDDNVVRPPGRVVVTVACPDVSAQGFVETEDGWELPWARPFYFTPLLDESGPLPGLHESAEAWAAADPAAFRVGEIRSPARVAQDLRTLLVPQQVFRLEWRACAPPRPPPE